MLLSRAVTFTYTNWKGETSTRTVLPIRLYWGSTPWHPGEQWLMVGYDVDKKAERTFAVKEIETGSWQSAGLEDESVSEAAQRGFHS